MTNTDTTKKTYTATRGATSFTVQYRDQVLTMQGYVSIGEALTAGYRNGYGEAFDVSDDSGAIVWAWEQRA